MKLKIILIILTLFSLIFPKVVLGTEDINKFGIHILEPSDLPKAQELVNSSGGDWGWVTLVIRDDDMNFDKWQGFMNDCRERHLVPIVRIATHLERENWAKPKIDDVDNWVNFLNSLNWPVSEQYVIIYNEPNHSREYGGEINPQEYAQILNEFISKFKILNTKYLILNSGFDLAAANTKTTMESFQFMKLMNEEVPGIFEKIDGWVSHSYPNHGYLGKPWENSKHSVKGYEWELNYLKQLGVKKELSVFITETGWPKTISKIKKPVLSLSKDQKSKTRYYDEKTVSQYLKYAFENIWLKDKRVLAITPFVLNYPEGLFAEFSWINKEGSCSAQFETTKQMPKISWRPQQEFKSEVISISLPPFLPANTNYKGKIRLKNIGQSIWGESSNLIANQKSNSELDISDLMLPPQIKIKPGEKIDVDFSIQSSFLSGEITFGWPGVGEYKIKVFPNSTLTSFRYSIWEKIILKVKSIFY